MRALRVIGLCGLVAPLFAAAAPPASVPPGDEAVLAAMRAELARATAALHLPNAPAPYYVAYWVVDSRERSVEATLGAVVSDERDQDRIVKVELRVGSRESDNSNFAGSLNDGGDFMREAELISPLPAPMDDDGPALRRALWLATDAAYKGGVEVLERKQADKRAEIALRDVRSFSEEPAVSVVVPEPKKAPPLDAAELAKRVSTVFKGYPEIQKSDVHVLETATRRRFVSSEGGLAIEPQTFSGIEITCSTQAADGMALERSAFVSAKPGEPLSETAATDEARRIAKELVALTHAPVVDDYAGPVLFEGKAAAQLVYELLSEALSGTPAPEGNEDLEGPLSRKLGRRVLPRGMSIIDDPTRSELASAPLLGAYAVDDEGVPAARANLVEDGRLVGFLMSRTPREGALHSNGHGRSGLVGWARGHVANLIVTAKSGLGKKDLRRRLAEAAHDEEQPAGLVVTELEPRTSATNGQIVPPPQMAYRIGLDGKETLVRGANIADMSVRDLRDLLATGKEGAVYSFLAESQGGLDTGVSVVSPALLVEDVEINGPKTPNKRPPVVPAPSLK